MIVKKYILIWYKIFKLGINRNKEDIINLLFYFGLFTMQDKNIRYGFAILNRAMHELLAVDIG